MATNAKKDAPKKERETALGSALKSAIAKNGGAIETVKTKPAPNRPKTVTRAATKPITKAVKTEQLAPVAQEAVKTAARKVAKKVAAKKPARVQPAQNVDPVLSAEELSAAIKSGKPYAPAVLKAYKEQLTHKLNAIIKEANAAGLLVHIPLVNGRPFVKFHNKDTYKPKQVAPVVQAA